MSEQLYTYVPVDAGMTAQRRLVLIGALLMAIFAGGVAVGESAVPMKPICVLRTSVLDGECPGYLLFRANASFAPKVLSQRGTTPVAVGISGGSHYAKGGHPPPMRESILWIDRHVEIDAVGVPKCGRSAIVAKGFTTSRRICSDAIVGAGTVRIEIVPRQSGGAADTHDLPLTIFNAGVWAGVTTLLLHARPTAGLGAPLLAAAKVKAIEEGRYGTELVVKIPALDRDVSVVAFRLQIRRRVSGLVDGIVSARCPDGHLNLKMTNFFADGTRLSGTMIRPCVPAPS